MFRIVNKHKLWMGVVALLAAVLFLHQTTYAQTPVTIDLCATTGTLTLPDTTVVTTWGYALGDCTGGAPAEVPGPLLTVPQGSTVEITLHNNLAEDTALNLPAISLIPDTTGVASGGSKTYTFVASEPGTYLYEAGLLPNSPVQVAMGMYGALVVESGTANQAYNDAATAYDDQAVLVLGEIDPNLSNSIDPSTFNMRDYNPRYALINGVAYPDTAAIMAQPSSTLLLRYVNGSLAHHSMGLLGVQQRILAYDASPLPYAYNVGFESVAPGQTLDTLVSIPATTTSTGDTRYALYDGNLRLNNGMAAGYGGMLTFIELTTSPSGSDTGPGASSVSLTPATTDGTVDVALTATVSDASTGAEIVSAAEYFIDTPGADGTGIAMTAVNGFDSDTEAVQATLLAGDVAALAAGDHTIYVHGQDQSGDWGSFNFAVLHLDLDGPTTSGMSLTPNPSGSGDAVLLMGTASDAATGNSAVTAAEYFIGAPGADGAGTAVTVTGSGAIVGLDATIPGGMTEGTYTIFVHAQDDFGHWGGFTSIDLLVDETGPAVSNVVASPEANNGSLPYSPTQNAVRVDMIIEDIASGGVNSTVSTAEGFIDYNAGSDADGSGFPLTPSDGLFDEALENGFVFIPLTTINLLADGTHTLDFHGRDAAGNWGPIVSISFVIDRTAPTVSAVSVSPDPAVGVPAALTATAVDGETSVALAEYFIGADPGAGNGTAMTVAGSNLSATIDTSTMADGTYTLNVRARDAAGNWSAVGSTSLTVESPPTPLGALMYFSTIGGGNGNPVPGVSAPYDDADIYNWDGSGFGRTLDANVQAGLPGNADIDGLVMVSDTEFYASFDRNLGTNVPGIGTVDDEDVVHYDNGIWSLYFDGSAECGLGASNGQDLDAIDIIGGVLYFSTQGGGNGNPVSGVAGPYDDADIYSWDGNSCGRVFDASANGLPGNADIDGLSIVDGDTFYATFVVNAGTNLPGLGTAQDEDVVMYDAGTWTFYLQPAGMSASNGQNIDALDIP